MAQMTQAFLEDANSSNAKQDASQDIGASSCVWKTMRRCKEWCKHKRFLVLVCCLVTFVFVLVLVIIVQSVAKPGMCPSEWIGYRNKCYFFSEEEKNWTSSQTFCTKHGSLLAVFENQEEMHALTKHLKMDDFWIGLRKTDERFYWENGIALEMDMFQIWNYSDCAYLYASIISTSACSLPRRWICASFP